MNLLSFFSENQYKLIMSCLKLEEIRYFNIQMGNSRKHGGLFKNKKCVNSWLLSAAWLHYTVLTYSLQALGVTSTYQNVWLAVTGRDLFIYLWAYVQYMYAHSLFCFSTDVLFILYIGMGASCCYYFLISDFSVKIEQHCTFVISCKTLIKGFWLKKETKQKKKHLAFWKYFHWQNTKSYADIRKRRFKKKKKLNYYDWRS